MRYVSVQSSGVDLRFWFYKLFLSWRLIKSLLPFCEFSVNVVRLGPHLKGIYLSQSSDLSPTNNLIARLQVCFVISVVSFFLPSN